MLARQAYPRRLLGTVPCMTYRIPSCPAATRIYSRVAVTGASTRSHGNYSPRPPTRHSIEDPSFHSLINKQLRHFDDPYHMAKHVESELEHGRLEQALVFIRKASATAKCVVAWNYIIRHMLRDQRMRLAIKTYNEMKKRGQQPNAQTYTIIFSGLARSSHSTQAVSEAVKLYQSMLVSDRGVQPNEIHLNAVVNVCARAQDIDSMFSIIESADDKGLSPSRVTYAIILHALRASVEAEAASNRVQFMTQEQLQENKNQTLQRCKTIWDEVIRRWRSGKLLIDEELVCAMGRILLLGDKSDTEATLDLVAQTMRLPNLHTEDPKGEKSGETASVAHRAGSGLFVRPGNNTLSMLLQALTERRLTAVAMKYWSLLTTHYHIVPDSNNWHWLMTVIKRSHASARAADMVEIMPRKFLNYTTFRMAMAACFRDTNNHNMYEHADRVVAVMLWTLKRPDPETTREYLTVVTSRLNYARNLNSTVKDPKAIQKARTHFKAILASLDTLWAPINQELGALEYSGVDHNVLKTISGTAYNETAELMSIARRLVALYDQLLQSTHFPKEDLLKLKEKRGDLIRHITTFYVPTEVSDDSPAAPTDEDWQDSRPRRNPRGDHVGTDDWQNSGHPAHLDSRHHSSMAAS